MLKYLINKNLLNFKLIRNYSSPCLLPKTINYQLKNTELNSNITVKGWVKSVRKQKNLIFVELNDGSQFDNLQLILEADKLENVNTGTCLEVSGKLSNSPGKNQTKEVLISNLKVLGSCPTEDYPLQKKRHTLEFVRANAHLRARTNTNSSVLRVRNSVLKGLNNYFYDEEFIQVHTPLITSNDCEGGGEVFRVESNESVQSKPSGDKSQFTDYFGSPAYLSVSGQLHLEALTSGMSRTYCINPAFRAEKSMTSRHLAEFWMCEAEIAFIDSLDQLTRICEDSVKGSIKQCLNDNKSDLQFFAKFYDKTLLERLEAYTSTQFSRITYTKAIEILQASGVKFEHPVEWGLSLQSEHEKYLAQEYYKSPVFVTDYPKELKPFYMKLNPDGKTVACFDLLVPYIGELAGGSMREDNYDILLENIKHHKMDLESFKWYIDLRKFGSFPHGGYGIGLDRLVQFTTSMQSIRDVIPFPRYFNNCNY